MKSYSLLILFVWFVVSCTPSEEQNLTVGERIAKAHGFDSFSDVTELKYTFNVQRDTLLFGRSWQWEPQSGDIVYSRDEERIEFNQFSDMDDEMKRIDHRFINDKYWLLFPFQLVWDTDVSYIQEENKPAPISGEVSHHVIVSYSANGGYTPGDVYELFCDDDWIIREWIFRRGGEAEPSIICTWEGYQEMNGMMIATDHRNQDGSFRLFFTGLEVK